MNSIVNRHLDRTQEQAIYELTLKKQRSKKSTISRKQMERMQQLASELMPQRKDLADLISDYSAASVGHCDAEQQHQAAQHEPFHDLCRCESSVVFSSQRQRQLQQKLTTPTSDSANAANNNNNNNNELQRQSSTSTIATNSTSSSGGSSSGAQTINTHASSCLMSDETSIRVSQMRLEHLNQELKRRLNQYEYLVAQEKAILGAYNMALITNEGVNNFDTHNQHQQTKVV